MTLTSSPGMAVTELTRWEWRAGPAIVCVLGPTTRITKQEWVGWEARWVR